MMAIFVILHFPKILWLKTLAAKFAILHYPEAKIDIDNILQIYALGYSEYTNILLAHFEQNWWCETNFCDFTFITFSLSLQFCTKWVVDFCEYFWFGKE